MGDWRGVEAGGKLVVEVRLEVGTSVDITENLSKCLRGELASDFS